MLQTVLASSTTTLDELTEQVRSKLAGRMRDLRLSMLGQGIVLQGHARSYYTKQLAQHAVMQASDFPILSNMIEVSPLEPEDS